MKPSFSRFLRLLGEQLNHFWFSIFDITRLWQHSLYHLISKLFQLFIDNPWLVCYVKQGITCPLMSQLYEIILSIVLPKYQEDFFRFF
jgi:hypothetical protein